MEQRFNYRPAMFFSHGHMDTQLGFTIATTWDQTSRHHLRLLLTDLTEGDLLHLDLQCMVNHYLTNHNNGKEYQHGGKESLLESYLTVILQSCVATKDCLSQEEFDVVLKNGNQIS